MRRTTLAACTLAIIALGTVGSMAPTADAQNRTYRRSGWYRSSATVPAGTSVNVRIDSKISTEDATSGDSWSGTVSQSVVSSGGRVVIPAGSPVTGVVTAAAQGTHKERPYLDLAVRQVNVNGRWVTMNAGTEPIVADSKRAKKIGAVVGGAAVGALLGRAVAKDHHGTLIGGLLGGAAGYGATRHALRTLQLKPGTVVTFQTNSEVLARR